MQFLKSGVWGLEPWQRFRLGRIRMITSRPRARAQRRMRELVQTLLWMLALVLANGIFSAAEIAVVSVRRSRIKHLMEEGSRSARAVDRLHGQVETFLATVQVGVTGLSALGAALGGATLAAPVAQALRDVPVRLVQEASEQIALGIVVVGYSFVSIVLGELLPKSIGLRFAEPLSLRMARPLLGLGTLFKPLVFLLTASANLLLRPLRDRTHFTESRLTAEEIKLLIGEAAASGAIEKRRAEIIERAVDFGERIVEEVMVPRPRIIGIDLKTSSDEIRLVLLEQGHTRMPVFDGDLDKVVGYITAKDILPLFGERELIVLKDIIRPAFFVPTSMRAVDLLRALQKRHEHLAVVVDEYGGTAGLVTTEDLVEEIVGDLLSEHATEPDPVKPESQGTWLVAAALPVRELNRRLEAELPEDAAYETLGGLVTHLAGAIPAAGQAFAVDGFELQVVERSERSVKQVRVRRLEPKRDAQDDGAPPQEP